MFKAHVQINTIVKKELSKIADTIELANTKPPLLICFTGAPARDFCVTIQLEKHLNQRISILNAVIAFLICKNKINLAMFPARFYLPSYSINPNRKVTRT